MYRVVEPYICSSLYLQSGNPSSREVPMRTFVKIVTTMWGICTLIMTCLIWLINREFPRDEYTLRHYILAGLLSPALVVAIVVEFVQKKPGVHT